MQIKATVLKNLLGICVLAIIIYFGGILFLLK